MANAPRFAIKHQSARHRDLLQPLHRAGAKAHELCRPEHARALGELAACGLELLGVNAGAAKALAHDAGVPGGEGALGAIVALTVLRPAWMRLRIMVRSNSAKAPVIWNSRRPIGVVVSMFC
jgi:hypothetical protein